MRTDRFLLLQAALTIFPTHERKEHSSVNFAGIPKPGAYHLDLFRFGVPLARAGHLGIVCRLGRLLPSDVYSGALDDVGSGSGDVFPRGLVG